jgi:hypothetical protein
MEVKEKHSGNVAQHQVLEAKALKELSSKHHIISKKKKKKGEQCLCQNRIINCHPL